MLEKIKLNKKVGQEEYKSEIKALKSGLEVIPQKIKAAGLPVIILFDGWGAAGKGGMISDLILNFDPRGFKVHSNAPADEAEKRKPLLWRYWQDIPENGMISVLDRSWYQDVSIARIEENLDSPETLRRINSIKTFERQLTDGGYLILKFFLHISQKEQKSRFDKLDSSKNTEWRVTEQDRRRNRNYDEYYRAFDEMLEYTDTPNAPWHIISGHDRNTARLDVYRIVLNSIEKALSEKKAPDASPDREILIPKTFTLLSMPKLSEISLEDKTLPKEKYEKQLKKLQETLGDLHNELYRKRVPVIMAYEGWDAAGKGGTIRRVAASLDPRGYEVIPIASPSKFELNHHYLWRFWNHIPRTLSLIHI